MRSYSSPVSYVSNNRPGSDNLLSCLVFFLAVGLFASVFAFVWMVSERQAQEELESIHLVCFDSNDNVVDFADAFECRAVTIREQV